MNAVVAALAKLLGYEDSLHSNARSLEQKQMMVAETSIRHTQTLQTDTLPLDESISVHNEMASHAIIKFQLRLAAAVHTDS